MLKGEYFYCGIENTALCVKFSEALVLYKKAPHHTIILKGLATDITA